MNTNNILQLLTISLLTLGALHLFAQTPSPQSDLQGPFNINKDILKDYNLWKSVNKHMQLLCLKFINIIITRNTIKTTTQKKKTTDSKFSKPITTK